MLQHTLSCLLGRLAVDESRSVLLVLLLAHPHLLEGAQRRQDAATCSAAIEKDCVGYVSKILLLFLGVWSRSAYAGGGGEQAVLALHVGWFPC
jgi:hypothetical protein